MEKHFRPTEVAQLTGLALATIRKKIHRREIAYRKGERAILIPQSEVERLMGRYLPAVAVGARKSR